MPFPKTQHSLLADIKRADHSRWGEFYTLYFPTLVVLARNQGLSGADAEDVAQHVMVRLIDALRDFQYQPERGLFRSWLTRLTINSARTFRRKHARRGALQDAAADDGLLPVPTEKPSPDAKLTDLERQELWRALVESVLEDYANQPRVEPRNAEIARRCLLGDDKAAEVAGDYDLPPGHVHVIQSRALTFVRKRLRHLFPDAASADEIEEHQLFRKITDSPFPSDGTASKSRNDV